MKAKKIAALCLASVLLLSGCGGKTVDGKSVVASTSEGNVYADDVYDTLISTSAGKSAAFQYVLDQLINKQYPVTSDMKDNASDMLDSIKNSYKSQYGEDSYEKQFKSDLKSAGYESESKYKKKLVYSLQYAELVKHYVKTHYDTVFDDYYKVSTPRVISMIKISTSDISETLLPCTIIFPVIVRTSLLSSRIVKRPSKENSSSPTVTTSLFVKTNLSEEVIVITPPSTLVPCIFLNSLSFNLLS